MKILFQNRDHSTHFGGDQYLVEGLIDALKKLGHFVDYNHKWDVSLDTYDLVHLWHVDMGWSLPIAQNAKKQNKPLIVTSLFYNVPGNSSFLTQIMGIASKVVSNSSLEQEQLLEAISPLETTFWIDKFCILPNGIRGEFLRHGVFCAGRYEDFKGQLKVVRAAKRLNIPVTVAGSLGDEYYKGLCEQEDYGEVLDHLDYDEMAAMYMKSRVYVCASLHERNSVTCDEAKAMGCKLVVTEGNLANRELRPDAIFDPNDEEDLVRKLELIYNDYALSFEQLAERYLEIYDQAIKN